MIIDSPIISGSYAATGSLNQTGDVVITGSLTVTGTINGSITGSITTASYALNAETLDGLDSTSFVTTSSFNSVSGSFSTRVTNLESFSSSLDATFATDAQLAAVSQSLSSSLSIVSGSLSSRVTNNEATGSSLTTASGSFSTRVTNNEATGSSLVTASGSFSTRTTNLETASGSFSTRVTNTEATASNLTTASSSFSTRVTNTEATASSLVTASGSFSTRTTNLETASGSFSTRTTNLEIASGSFSTRVTNTEATASNIVPRVVNLEATASSLTTASSSFSTRVTNTEATASSLVTASGSFSTRTTNLETASGSFSTRTTNLETASGSFSTRVTSAEGSITSLNSRSGSYATTGSNAFSGSQVITGSLTTTGTITAQTLNVQQVTSSIVYSSGSNIFGNSLANTQIMTGSVSITGSLTVTTTATEFQVGATGVTLGNVISDVHNVTGSLRVSGSVTAGTANVARGTAFTSPFLTNGGNLATTAGSTVRLGSLSFDAGGNGVGLGVYGLRQATGSSWTTTGIKLQLDVDNSTDLGGNLFISSNGNVGIGTTNPTVELDVVSSGGSGMRIIDSTSPNFYINNTSVQWKIYLPASSNDFRINDAVGDYVTIRYNSGNVGIGTTGNINQRLVVQGTVAAAGSVGYTLNGVTNGNQVLTGESSPRGVAGLTAVGTADSFAIKTDPLGRAFGTVGLVGAAYDQSGGGRNVLGIYGYALHNAATSNNTENKPVAGLFLSELGSNAGAGAVFNGTMYGVYASANSSGATNSAGSIIGVYGVATGRTNDTTYGGYFAASGGTTNYGLIVSSGNVGIGTTNPLSRLHINTGTNQNLRIRPGTDVSAANGIAINSRDDADATLQQLSLRASDVLMLVTGNVGIGVTNPTGSLHVGGSTTTLGAAQIVATVGGGPSAAVTFKPLNASSVNTTYEFQLNPNGGAYGFFIVKNMDPGDTQTILQLGGQNLAGDSFINMPSTQQNFSLRVNSSTRFYLQGSSGNVGIGTTSPSSKLHVVNSTDEVIIGTIGNDHIIGGRTGGSFGIKTRSGSNGNLILTADSATYLYTGTSNLSVFIKSDGNVGIGTTTPGYKLDVQGSAGISTTLRLVGGMTVGSDTTQWTLAGVANGGAIWQKSHSGAGGSDDRYLRLGNVDNNGVPNYVMSIINSSVGIGTTNPGYRLDVNSAEVRFGDGGSFTLNMNVPNSNTVRANMNVGGSARLTIQGDGNVGINSTSPAYRLDVAGSFRLSDRQFINGLTTLAYKIRYDQLSLGFGGLTTDSDAADGNAIFMNSASGSTMFFGPYTSITPGEYVASFRMKVQSNSSTSYLATIDVIGTNVLGSGFAITPSMFEASNRYQYIDIPFTVNGSSSNIEFRGISFQSGITTTYLDHIIIRPLAKNYTQLIPSGDIYNIYYTGIAAPRFTINTDGNIGVGVTSPRAALDLGSANNRGQVILLGEMGTNVRVGFGLDPANAGMRIFTLNQSDQQIEIGGISSANGTTWTRNHRFGIAGGNSWFNEQGGNVGIGTTSPKSRLDVNGTIGLTNGATRTYAATGDITITITGLQTLNGNNWRQAGGTILYQGVQGNLSDATTLFCIFRLQGLNTWDTLSVTNVVGTTTLTLSNATTTGCTLTLDVVNAVLGSALVQLIDSNSGNLS